MLFDFKDEDINDNANNRKLGLRLDKSNLFE